MGEFFGETSRNADISGFLFNACCQRMIVEWYTALQSSWGPIPNYDDEPLFLFFMDDLERS